MKVKRLTGQVKVAIGGLLLGAIVVLVILQAPKKADCYLYGHELNQISTIWVVLGSAVLGLLFIWSAKVLLAGLGVVRQTRETVRLERLEKRVADQESTAKKADR